MNVPPAATRLRSGVPLKINMAIWNTIQLLFPHIVSNANPPTPLHIAAAAPAGRPVAAGGLAPHRRVASLLNASRPVNAEFRPPRYASGAELVSDCIQTWLLQTAARLMAAAMRASAKPRLPAAVPQSPLSPHRCALRPAAALRSVTANDLMHPLPASETLHRTSSMTVHPSTFRSHFWF